MEDFKFTSVPAFNILILAIIGIFLGWLLNMNDLSLLISIVLATILCLILLKLKKYTLGTIIASMTIGLYIITIASQSEIKVPNKIIPEFPAMIEGKIEKILKKDSVALRCIVNGSIDSPDLPKVTNTRIILSILGSNSNDFHCDDFITARVVARTPSKQQIPTDFPENLYASSLGSQWYAKTSSKNVSIIGSEKGFSYYQEMIIDRIKSQINQLFSEDTRSIVLALTTGDKSKIPFETKTNYSIAGTAHILSVSGLHVGIIAIFIYLLLGFLRNRILKLIVFILSIFFFITLTGFQTPAIRAGVMAILVMIVYVLERRVIILNILSLAVLIMLIIEPTLIFSASFQMSALSVLGIALFYQLFKNKFEKLINIDNRILFYLTNSISLTLSASITVSPIVAYYFGIFSIVSPLTNLIIIPITSLAMIYSLFSIGVSFLWFGLGVIFASAVDFIIRISNSIIDFMSHLPLSHIKGESILIGSLIISFAILFIIFSKNIKQMILISSLMILILFSVKFILEDKNTDEIKIYPRQSLVCSVQKISENNIFVAIFDRNETSYIKNDYSLTEYLKNLDSKLIIGYDGLNGLSLAYQLKNSKNAEIFPMSRNFEKKYFTFNKLSSSLAATIDLE
jgi:competence protein ComEC